MAYFKITNMKIIHDILFPIFDKHILVTSKYNNYIKFKECYSILENVYFKTELKNKLILDIKNRTKSKMQFELYKYKLDNWIYKSRI